MNQTNDKKAVIAIVLALVGGYLLGSGAATVSNLPDGIAILLIGAGIGFVVIAAFTLRNVLDVNQQRLAKNTEAVSPVIAVILMVAITVVLAATVFVLVQDIGSGTQTAASPAMNLQTDETYDHVTVTSASPKADWSRIEIKADVPNVHFGLNKNAKLTDPSADSWGRVTTTKTVMQAGEYLGVCGPATGATLTIRDNVANSVVTTVTFQNLVPCT